jgi:cytochrome c553
MAFEVPMSMRVWRLALPLFLAPAMFAMPPQQGATHRVPPPWAYGLKTPLGSPPSEEPTPTPTDKLATDNGKVISLPGSPVSLTLTQMRNQPTVDWYPEDHPQMPEVVAQGRKPDILPCTACHYTNGKGDPANATIEALPYDYFVQTLKDFRDGLRKSADPRKINTPNMIKYAKAMTDDEIEASAKYYGAIPLISRIKVIESRTVPKTRLVAAGLYFPLPGKETEPLGNRLIEVPETPEAFIYKNPRADAVVYVPVGSTRKGERLVLDDSDGKTIPCAYCHGADLLGLGRIPGIAGRLPGYMVRQLFDMQNGARTGTWAEMMQPVVEKLTIDDMINITAYLSSRKVGGAH